MNNFNSVTFNSNMMSQRNFYENYNIVYNKINNNTIAYLVGTGEGLKDGKKLKDSKQRIEFKDLFLLNKLVNFGKFLDKNLPADIENKRKVITENSISYDDSKISDTINKIFPKLLEIVKLFGCSIDTSHNAIFDIIKKTFMIYRIQNIWKEISCSINSTEQKIDLKKIKHLINLINGNTLDNPVKYIMEFNKENLNFDLIAYSPSILSLATYQLMLHIANDNLLLYKRCKYCNDIFEAADKRMTWCQSEDCKKEKRRIETKENRERDATIKKLYNTIICKLKGDELINFKKQYNKKFKKIPNSKGGKDKLIEWLSNIQGK